MKLKFFLSFLVILVAFQLAGCKKSNKGLLAGKIKRETIALSPKVTGRILKLFVEEGQTVIPGDTLAMLDVPEISAKMAQARGVVKASSAQRLLAYNGYTENQLKQLRARYAANKEQYAFAQKSYERANAMFVDSLISPQAHDEAYAKYQSAQSQLEAVTAELNEAERGTRYETKMATSGQNDQASGVLQEVEIAYSERYILATNTMTIETITLRQGELAVAGYPVFNGYLTNSTWFRFTIPESQIASFKKGDRIIVTVPYNKKTYDGKILTIKQLPRYADITTAYPDYDMDDAVYEIKIIPSNVKEAEELLYNASITINKKNSAL
jgi:HlyD family secretion protein